MSTRDVCQKENTAARMSETENASAGRYVCLSEKITDWNVYLAILNADTRRMSERGNYRLARMSKRENIATAGRYECLSEKIPTGTCV